MSTLIASGGMLSGPGALPVFSLSVAFLISVLLGLLVLMGSVWELEAGGLSTGSVGGGLLRSSLKCSAHLFNWSSWLECHSFSFCLIAFLWPRIVPSCFSAVLHSLPVLQVFYKIPFTSPDATFHILVGSGVSLLCLCFSSSCSTVV